MRALKDAGRKRRALRGDCGDECNEGALLHQTGLRTRTHGERLLCAAERALACNHLGSSLALFSRAESFFADQDRCAGGRWLAYMLQGEFEAAWKECDAIRSRKQPDTDQFWKGEEVRNAHLVVRSLHGYGDSVQMFRFLPRLRPQVASLTIAVPMRLVELTRSFDAVDFVIPLEESDRWSRGRWDVEVEVLELPYLLRVTRDDLAPTQGYLRLPTQVQAATCDALGSSRFPRVGLVWKSGTWDSSRSIEFSVLLPLLLVKGIEIWSLQGEPEHSNWIMQYPTVSCRDVYSIGNDIVTLAAAIEQMDLVISVDTLAPHLAGALGVECWLLLQQVADWRWMVNGQESPWYPSLTLWRQEIEGEWDGVVERVRVALETWSLDRIAGKSRSAEITHPMEQPVS